MAQGDVDVTTIVVVAEGHGELLELVMWCWHTDQAAQDGWGLLLPPFSFLWMEY